MPPKDVTSIAGYGIANNSGDYGEIFIGDPVDNGSWSSVSSPNIRTITTNGKDMTVISQLPIMDSVSINIGEDKVSKEEYEKEIKKRDDKISELESKLESLTKQVASILDGNKEIIDENIETEKLKSLFED